MTSSLAVAPSLPVGHQRPRVLWTPPGADLSPGTVDVPTPADDAIWIAGIAGLVLDDWQQFGLRAAMAETPACRWCAYEVGLVVARQNGKGGILEARELYGLFIRREPLILHSAHQFDTAMEAFLRLLALIENTPELDRQVKRVSRVNGDQGIETVHGSRIRFKARTGKGGRGFTGSTVILDEAMYLPPAVMSALQPTMSAAPNSQLWYVGSAVDAAEHEHGQTFTAVRNRALAGGDPALCWAEWSPPFSMADVEEGRVDLSDPAVWAWGNPTLGDRISHAHVANEQRSMRRRSFAVERCSIGDWPVVEDEEHLIDPKAWRESWDPRSAPTDPVAFAVDMTPDRSRIAIAVAARREDGRWHGEPVEDLRLGERDERTGELVNTEWVLDLVAGMARAWDPCALVLDAAGAAGSLRQGLLERGIEPVTTTARQMAEACGGLWDDIHQDRWRWRAGAERVEAALNDAVADAQKRDLGGAWVFDRWARSPVYVLAALALARWGVVTHGRPVVPPASPVAVAATGAARSATADLARIGF